MLSVKLIHTINPPMTMLTKKSSNSPYLLQSTVTKPIPNDAAAPASDKGGKNQKRKNKKRLNYLLNFLKVKLIIMVFFLLKFYFLKRLVNATISEERFFFFPQELKMLKAYTYLYHKFKS